MIIPRSWRRTAPLGWCAWLVLAIALAPIPAAATDQPEETPRREPSLEEPAPPEEADGGGASIDAITPTEPVPAMPAGPEAAPALPGDPAPAAGPSPAAEPGPAAVAAPPAAAEAPPDLSVHPAAPSALAPGTLTFDLLGPEAAPAQVDERGLRVRRKMLEVHQGLGIGLLALELGTTVFGQLNYSDRFHGSSTGKYRTPHAVFAYSTLGVFGATALVALLAPSPEKRREGFDRVTLHKIAMFAAKAGMITEGILGVYAHNREGHLNQRRIATTHLAIGYATLAAMALGVGALTF